jgi:hypothetical protein
MRMSANTVHESLNLGLSGNTYSSCAASLSLTISISNSVLFLSHIHHRHLHLIMNAIRASPRKIRKAPIVYNPGDKNALGERNQPNEMGADIFKDKRQRELIDFFHEVLEFKG